MPRKHKQLVLALFDSEDAAEKAADRLKRWDKKNRDVKARALSILVKDEKVTVKKELPGARAGRKGAGSGALVGLIAAVPTAGLSLLEGVLGGAVIGWVVGSFHHRRLRLSNDDQARLAKELDGGKAAVGVLVAVDEAAAFRAKLQELCGKPEMR
jgi:uncharacterized membrane protein